METVTFITGNQNKADYLVKLLGLPIEHQKVDLDEIQSTNLKEVVEHKVRQAYEIIKKPVLVEDVSLVFNALSGLPGPFIKFFVDESGLDACCKMLDGFSDRSARASCVFGYYDGKDLHFFEGGLNGQIAKSPRGESGYGWDRIFEPEGYGGKTRAELSQAENDKTYQIIKPFDHLRDFLPTVPN